MLRHAINGCIQGLNISVREPALKADSGRNISCRTGDSNPLQYCAWPLSQTLYQMSCPRPLQSLLLNLLSLKSMEKCPPHPTPTPTPPTSTKANINTKQNQHQPPTPGRNGNHHLATTTAMTTATATTEKTKTKNDNSKNDDYNTNNNKQPATSRL